MYSWCGNVFFSQKTAYPGLVIHFHLYFDDQVVSIEMIVGRSDNSLQFPATWPRIALATALDHTHVHFPQVCFSLSADYKSYFECEKFTHVIFQLTAM